MKKILTIIAACTLICTGAQAQSLNSILGKVVTSAAEQTTSSSSSTSTSSSTVSSILSAVMNTVTGATSTPTLSGSTLTYTGTAVALSSSSSTVASLASSTANTAIEEKLDKALAKVGVKSGLLVFKFASDSTFTCTFRNIPLEGTYTQNGSEVKLKFGKTMKYLSMTGAAVSTTEGVKLVFEGTKFLSFIKTALAATKAKSTSATTSAISSAVNAYDGLKIGFNLKK